MGVSLKTAGMISGAGQAVGASLLESQKYMGMAALQDAREKMEAARQDKNLAAQQAMHTETIKGQQAEGLATRTQAKELAGEQRDLSRELQTEKIGAEKGMLSEKIGAEDRQLGKKLGAEEELQGKKLESDKDIHDALNQTNKEIAQMHERATTKSTRATNITALQKDLDQQEDNVRLLQIEANKILTDPNSQAAKDIQESINRTKTNIKWERDYFQQLIAEGVTGAMSESTSTSTSKSRPQGPEGARGNIIKPSTPPPRTIDRSEFMDYQRKYPNAKPDALIKALSEKGLIYSPEEATSSLLQSVK